MFIGVLDLPTGNLRYCNGGHDCPLLLEKGIVRKEMCRPHLPLGVFDDTKYDIQETLLAPDSTLFLYTDGLTEARRERKQFFGIERTVAVLDGCLKERMTPRQILERVTAEVHRYVRGAEQSDDLTMLAIHYTPRPFESTLTETLSIKNDIHEVPALNAFQKSFYGKMSLETSLAHQLQLSVEEAVVNVIDYAYPIGTDGDITIKMMTDGQSLKIVIVDSGVIFDPTLVEKADTTLSAEERKIGGLGIYLVREFMDSINYERVDGNNILTLIKYLKNS
jgi:sigma-B regulation protein RsbU (phosphoserine phosphatase)